MTEEELREIQERAEAADAGPWYARSTDDQSFMCAMYVGLDEGSGMRHDNKRGMDLGWQEQVPDDRVIAITLLQSPRLVGGEDGHWEENAEFIAHARSDIPRLLDEVARLRNELADCESQRNSAEDEIQYPQG